MSNDKAARESFATLRELIESLHSTKRVLAPGEYEALTAHLNTLADRLQTCTALEWKTVQMRNAHSVVINTAATLCLEMRVRSVPVDPLNPEHDPHYSALVEALVGVGQLERK